MNKEEILKSRYIQWGYESYKDNKTGEIRSDYIDRLNEQDQELALYKKALEIALREQLKEINQSLGVMGAGTMTYNDLLEDTLQQAKERINGTK